MKNRSIPRGPLLLMAGLAVLAGTLVGVLYGKYDYSELCPVCGRARDVVGWQIPATVRTYYSLREERATALSDLLEQRQLTDVHEHSWQFVRGHGNGRSIVLGAGHSISWSLHSPHMGAFMETVLHLTDRDTALRWLHQLQDPVYSRLCQAMARSAFGRTFTSREEWEGWVREFETEHAQLIIHVGAP